VFITLAYVSTKALRVALGATLAVLATVALVAASPAARAADGNCQPPGSEVVCSSGKSMEYVEVHKKILPLVSQQGNTREVRKARSWERCHPLLLHASLGGTTAGAEVPTATKPTTRVFPKTKLTLVVVALIALAAFAALIAASQAPNAEPNQSSAGSTVDQSGAGAPVSQPAAPQMSENEALDAYGKLPLSFIPNEGQTDEAVRYYAQGAGYGFFFTKEGAMLSFAEGKAHGHALALDFLGADPGATLEAQERLSGEVN
jgi:hypothetical protein